MRPALITTLAATLAAGCTLQAQDKDHCRDSNDCALGLTCDHERCVTGGAPSGAGGMAGGSLSGMAGAGGSAGTAAMTSAGGDGGRPGGAAGNLGGSSGTTPTAGAAGSAFRGQGGDAGGAASPGGNAGAAGAGGATAPPVTCTEPMKPGQLSCLATVGGMACAEEFCGGRLWTSARGSPDAYIPYRIDDPSNVFSTDYRAAIHASAQAWSDATAGHVRFDLCATTGCSGRYIAVVPGDGHGIANPGAVKQLLPMPIAANGQGAPPLHQIAHQWGHAIGLDDTYKRVDRDRYVRFDAAVLCQPDVGVPPRCASLPPSSSVVNPPISTGTFGVYDELSKMNGFAADGICGTAEPDRNSGLPTLGDASAVIELYAERATGWAPWQPLAQSMTPSDFLDYHLADTVQPVGGLAVAAWFSYSVEIFARGSDGAVYANVNDPGSGSFLKWNHWTNVGAGVDSDPAAVFLDGDTLALAARSTIDQGIVLRTRRFHTWGDWTPLGAPAVGADSAPAIATPDGKSLTIIVRGTDGLLYQQTCSDPLSGCVANGNGSDRWTSMEPPPTWSFIGKPNAIWSRDAAGAWLVVAAVGTDRHAHWLVVGNGGAGSNHPRGWQDLLSLDLAPGDPDPTVAVATHGSYDDVAFFARDRRNLLTSASKADVLSMLGGVLASPPSVTGTDTRFFAASLLDDHGQPGVWLKFAGGFTPPCTYNLPTSCRTCGCDLDTTFRCDM